LSSTGTLPPGRPSTANTPPRPPSDGRQRSSTPSPDPAAAIYEVPRPYETGIKHLFCGTTSPNDAAVFGNRAAQRLRAEAAQNLHVASRSRPGVDWRGAIQSFRRIDAVGQCQLPAHRFVDFSFVDGNGLSVPIRAPPPDVPSFITMPRVYRYHNRMPLTRVLAAPCRRRSLPGQSLSSWSLDCRGTPMAIRPTKSRRLCFRRGAHRLSFPRVRNRTTGATRLVAISGYTDQIIPSLALSLRSLPRSSNGRRPDDICCRPGPCPSAGRHRARAAVLRFVFASGIVMHSCRFPHERKASALEAASTQLEARSFSPAPPAAAVSELGMTMAHLVLPIQRANGPGVLVSGHSDRRAGGQATSAPPA